MRCRCYSDQIAFGEYLAFVAVPIQGGCHFLHNLSRRLSAMTTRCDLAIAGANSRVFEGWPLHPSSHPACILHRLHLGSIALLGNFTHDTIRLLRLAIKRIAESSCHPSANKASAIAASDLPAMMSFSVDVSLRSVHEHVESLLKCQCRIEVSCKVGLTTNVLIRNRIQEMQLKARTVLQCPQDAELVPPSGVRYTRLQYQPQ
jgi:hypothetical protein